MGLFLLQFTLAKRSAEFFSHRTPQKQTHNSAKGPDRTKPVKTRRRRRLPQRQWTLAHWSCNALQPAGAMAFRFQRKIAPRNVRLSPAGLPLTAFDAILQQPHPMLLSLESLMPSTMLPPNDTQPMASAAYFYQGVNARDGVIAEHVHQWGQICCIESGVASYSLNGNRLIGIPGIGVWLPPQVHHESYNYKTLVFNVMNISPDLCTELPNHACMLRLTDIFQVIFADFFKRTIQEPTTPSDLRLVTVLVDQLSISPEQLYFLPYVNDPLLTPIINHMEQNIQETIQLNQWAKKLFTTERTIARRFQNLLNMSFRECQFRIRFLHAVTLLEQPEPTIEEVALALGYSSSSAFISMFRRFACVSPEQYRQRQLPPAEGQ